MTDREEAFARGWHRVTQEGEYSHIHWMVPGEDNGHGQWLRVTSLDGARWFAWRPAPCVCDGTEFEVFDNEADALARALAMGLDACAA